MTAEQSSSSHHADLVLETEPRPEDVAFLEERLIDFSIRTTGITDGKFIGIFLRKINGSPVGGVYGWTWGGTCYIRYLFVPEGMRRQGEGARLMRAVEHEAKARNCRKIVLETYGFQAPGFYKKLGFEAVSRVADYPSGHEYITMVKCLA
jgi:ribosomal protein S18 acetylase RimI-like enzyme